MKRNKNAFTLIELLAVIVILAIIALIAVPVVMNIINKANKSAFKDSAYGIIKAGELFYTDQLMEESGMAEDKVFTFPNDTLGLEINGSKPTGGTMIVNKEGKISLAITNGKYCVTKGFEDSDVTISDDVTNCGESNGGNTEKTLADLVANIESATSTATSGSPLCITKGSVCAKGTLFTIKVNQSQTYNFYVLNDDGNKVDLIMDRNLGENVAWIDASDYGSTTVKIDKGPITALKTLKQRTSGWTNIPAYTYTLENDNDGGGGPYTYSPITATSISTATTEESPVENVRARLPKRDEISSIDEGKNPWLVESANSSYWTSTARSTGRLTSTYAYEVGANEGHLNLSSVEPSSSCGLRPVITLSK